MKSNTRFNTYPTFGNFLDNDAHATYNNTSSAIQNGRKIHLPETAQTRTVARKNNTNLVLDSIFYLNFVSNTLIYSYETCYILKPARYSTSS